MVLHAEIYVAVIGRSEGGCFWWSTDSATHQRLYIYQIHEWLRTSDMGFVQEGDRQTSGKLWRSSIQTDCENYAGKVFAVGYITSFKLYFRHFQLDYFPENLGTLSEGKGERFHQGIKQMERRYHGQWNVSVIFDYCWCLTKDKHPQCYTRSSTGQFTQRFTQSTPLSTYNALGHTQRSTGLAAAPALHRPLQRLTGELSPNAAP
jgi:hypothetical protein